MAFALQLPLFSLLAQINDATDVTDAVNQPHANPVAMIFSLLIIVLMIAALWKIFAKAGQPGWAALIPIYNTYILCKIAGKPGWWVILMLIPFVNFIIFILVAIGLARNFGKGAGFGLGIAFLSFIFLPILAFSDARYQGALPAPAL